MLRYSVADTTLRIECSQLQLLFVEMDLLHDGEIFITSESLENFLGITLDSFWLASWALYSSWHLCRFSLVNLSIWVLLFIYSQNTNLTIFFFLSKTSEFSRFFATLVCSNSGASWVAICWQSDSSAHLFDRGNRSNSVFIGNSKKWNNNETKNSVAYIRPLGGGIDGWPGYLSPLWAFVRSSDGLT